MCKCTLFTMMFPKLLNSKLKRKQANLRVDCCFKPDAYVMVASYLLHITEELGKNLVKNFRKGIFKCFKIWVCLVNYTSKFRFP